MATKEFTGGFKKGYVTGHKKSSISKLQPYVPPPPYQPPKKYGDPETDFEHGYNIGYEMGFEKGKNR